MEYEIQTTIRFKESVRQMLEELAKDEDRSLNQEINYIVKEYYKQKHQKADN